MPLPKEKTVDILQSILAQVYDYDIRITERELHSKFLNLTGHIIEFERYGYTTLKSFLTAYKLEALLLPSIMLASHFQELRCEQRQIDNTDSSTSDSVKSVETQYETKIHSNSTNKNGGADDELMLNLNQSFKHCFISKDVHVQQTDLKLPWGKEFWKLKVTHLQSATNVWARLVNNDTEDDDDDNWPGNNGKVSLCLFVIRDRIFEIICFLYFQDMFKNICTLLNAAMKRNPNQKVMMIQLNAIYVSKMLAQFYRVQIIQISKDRTQALCFFIDIGNKKWLGVDEVFDFIGDDFLLSIPPQAIRFAIKGLEVTHSSKIHDHLDLVLKWMNVYLIGKHVRAQITISANDFQNMKTKDGIGTITAVFFDQNSHGLHRNLNDEILDKFCVSLRSPTLSTDEFAPIEITNLNNSGAIYAHNVDSKAGIELLADEMSAITQPIPLFHEPPTLEMLKSHSGIQLVQKPMITDNKQLFYRVIICQKQTANASEMIKCNFIDYGYVEHMPYNCFVEANLFLQKYPSQAITVELADIGNLTVKKLTYLRSLLKPGDTVFVEVGKKGRNMIIPQVRMCKLVEAANAFGSINDFIRKLDV